MAHRGSAESELYLERLDFHMTVSVLGTEDNSGSCTFTNVFSVLVFPVNYSVAQVGCSAACGAPSKWLL